MKQNKDSLGDRMKSYERKYALTYDIPIILRLDGRAFHTLTRGMKKPFDLTFIEMMNQIGLTLCEEIQGCRMAYLQSDEISLLLLNKPDSDAWFDNELQKMCSVSASVAASIATRFASEYFPTDKIISFDARAFIIPRGDVVNYFIWRQQDWERNSLQMYTRYFYSQKEMEGKNKVDMHNMLYDIGTNWNWLYTMLKRGRCVVKKPESTIVENDYFKGIVDRNRWVIDEEIPIFTQNRDYIINKLE